VASLRYLVTLPGVPRRAISRVAGALARAPVPGWLREPLFGFLAARFGIDRAEVPGEWRDYGCFLEVFTRPLPEGSRPLPLGEAWLSPADGVLIERSVVAPEGTWLVKGAPYEHEELLPGVAGPLRGYQALQVYLAPSDYHRFHAPCSMEIVAAATRPGELLPVDPGVVGRSHRVLARNRRVVLHCRAADGAPFAMAFVAALNVGRMRFTFDDTLGALPMTAGLRRYDPPPRLAAGAEIGRFELGSTIVVVAPPGLRPLVEIGGRCRAREPLLAGRAMEN